jgi:hypothetical protein
MIAVATLERERTVFTIRIDDEVFARLQELAKPFVDDPNSVIRRVLGLPDAEDGPQRRNRGRSRTLTSVHTPQRAHSSELLPGSAYYLPILQALAERGGKARGREVIEAAGLALEDRLMPKDLEETSSGVIRWENRCRWAGYALRNGGLLNEGDRGVWELSETGWEAARNGQDPEFKGRRG